MRGEVFRIEVSSDKEVVMVRFVLNTQPYRLDLLPLHFHVEGFVRLGLGQDDCGDGHLPLGDGLSAFPEGHLVQRSGFERGATRCREVHREPDKSIHRE